MERKKASRRIPSSYEELGIIPHVHSLPKTHIRIWPAFITQCKPCPYGLRPLHELRSLPYQIKYHFPWFLLRNSETPTIALKQKLKSQYKIYSRIPNNRKPFAWFHGFVWETCKSKILFFFFFFLVNINLCWKPREREPSISIYFKCKALSHFERKSSFLVPNISFWIFLATQNSSKVSKLVSGSLVPLKITVSSLCKLYLLKKIE